jgi:hypothetical protein
MFLFSFFWERFYGIGNRTATLDRERNLVPFRFLGQDGTKWREGLAACNGWEKNIELL